MAPIPTAVGCAVGIPIGLGVVVALFFWARMQRRFKKEEEEDKELENVLQDNASITFGNLESLKQPGVWETKKHVSHEVTNEGTEGLSGQDQKTSEHHILGSGSSDGSLSHEEKLSASAAGNDRGTDSKERPQRRNSKMFVPAYRRKINSLQVKLTQNAGNSTSNSSSTSLTSSQRASKRQVSMYDQMIPVVAPDPQGIFDDNDGEKDNQSSNENLIRNLNNQDFGSYPRRASSSSLSQLHSTNHSSSSFHTRASSMNSALKLGPPADNVFATPKSEKALGNKPRNDERVDKQQEKHDDVYLLKNNYDITNSSEIAEEDQYENEFTNYSANKREFIDTLRPKKL